MIDLTTEDDLQKAVARVLDASGLPWFHYQAENPRRGRGFANARAKGVKKGVPDVMIFRPFKTKSRFSEGVLTAAFPFTNFSGLAIELKMPGNDPSDVQEVWLERLKANGWRTEVCKSLEQVLELLEECYGIESGGVE